MSTEQTLKERGETYGEFRGYAVICRALKSVVLDHSNAKLDDIHLESLAMIFSKIARILNGDPNHADNWHDIAGYAILVENEIRKKS